MATPLTLLLFGACAPVDSSEADSSEWTLILEGAELPESTCAGDSWDGDRDPPDPFVKTIANWNGEEWEADWVEDSYSPEWGLAVWDGAPVQAGDLREFGVSVLVLEYDDWAGEDQVARINWLTAEEAFSGDQFTVPVECVDVQFRLVRYE